DEDHQIVYSNPQFTELTNIAPSQVMDQPFSNLFGLVSNISPEQQQVYEQLMQAAKQIEGQSVEDAYPFVEIETLNQNNLVIEFMRVDTVSEQRGWIGVIGIQEQHIPQVSAEHSSKLQNLVEDMTMPIMELSNSTLTLPQQYDMLSHGNFEALLQRLEGDVRQMQSMWGNFVQIYKGEIEGIALRPTAIEPSTFVENALSNRRMALYQRQIRFEHNTTDVEVYIDERQMRQCVINLIEFLAGLSKPNAPIFAELMTEGTQVIITLQEKTTILAPDAIKNIFNPRRDTDNKDDLFPYRLGMYYAQQIVQAHKGQLMVNNARGSGLMIRLALPLMGEEDTFIPIMDDSELTLQVEAAKDKSNYRQSAKGLTVTIVESRSKFMQGVYPKMEVEGHDLIPEARLDGALFDLKMTKVDLVILEIDRYSPDVVGQVQKIRSQYEVPIVIIALEEYEEDCLSALSQGADDYFLMPLNEEKLIAQLQAISKRLELAARTAEPIKVGGLEIDFSRRRVYLDGKLIDLTAKEYELLRVLVMNRGQVMSHKALLAKVWGPEHDNETQYLWVNISRLRRKLEPKKDSPRYIQNEPRVGYVFATDM
ncbi:MAG: winged helix-turn-helix domain-containing protein, partial [Chloroflexota bacterium]